MSDIEEKKIFWLDGFNGYAEGGYFLRNDLKDFFKKLEERGIRPVGIRYDGSYNLEIIVETEVKKETQSSN